MVGPSKSWVQQQPMGSRPVAYTRARPTNRLLSCMSLRSLGQARDGFSDIFFIWGPDLDRERHANQKEPVFYRRNTFILPALVVPPPIITRDKDVPGVVVRQTSSINVKNVILDFVMFVTVPVYFRVICFQKRSSKFPVIVTKGAWPRAGFTIVRGEVSEIDFVNEQGGLFLARQNGGSVHGGYEVDSVDGQILSAVVDEVNSRKLELFSTNESRLVMLLCLIVGLSQWSFPRWKVWAHEG